MMRQYLQTKEEYKDCILMYRLGDFYEMFFDDAQIASRELEISLTGRDCGLDERAPMCGIPYHSVTPYIAKLIQNGYKVAICDQTEDPKLAKGIVKRDVTRVVTPGTLTEEALLDEKSNNYLAVIFIRQGAAALVFSDISTGEMFATEVFSISAVLNETARYNPTEIIINSNHETVLKKLSQRFSAPIDSSREYIFDSGSAEEIVLNHFKTDNLAALKLNDKYNITTAVAAMLRYLFHTQKSTVPFVDVLTVYSVNEFMGLDISTRRNLELTGTLRDNSRKGSLIGAIDRTRTAMGARELRRWIEKPLIDASVIESRLSGVEELVNTFELRDMAKEALDLTYDISRITTRAASGNITPKDMLALRNTLESLPILREIISRSKSEKIHNMSVDFDELSTLCEFLRSAIKDDASTIIRDGNIIKEGHNAKVDELRDIKSNGKKYLDAFIESERERTGIPKLKLGYNKVFGYYIEITKSLADKAPEDYIRRQTLVNNERFTTVELKKIEEEIMSASDKLLTLELELYREAINEIMDYFNSLKDLADVLSELDCLYSLAETAVKNNYVRPIIDNSGIIEIYEGRHPVVESMSSVFVPNDTLLDTDKNRLMIITGPNMAGKSTYMRQTALITLMAQIGSFVPAKSAHIGIVDKIFTRVGASDDIASGQSTFMLEMTEVANILKTATPRSLIILDEIGRGTSTFDGLSIAWAVAEYVHDKKRLGAKTLFATHYHEMTEMEDYVEGIKNYNIAVRKKGDEITFLRKIVRGGADRSYGIEVAALAGVPKPVISSAKRILEHLEKTNPNSDKPVFEQLILNFEDCYDDNYTVEDENIIEPEPINSEAQRLYDELRSLNVSSMTIIEAASKLYDLVQEAKGGQNGNN